MLTRNQVFAQHPLSELLQNLRNELALLQEQLEADWARSDGPSSASPSRASSSGNYPAGFVQNDAEPVDENELPPPRLRRAPDGPRQ